MMVVKQQKMRKCLRCGKPFRSMGPGNRICTECIDKEPYDMPMLHISGEINNNG
jgi:hypothetical protein